MMNAKSMEDVVLDLDSVSSLLPLVMATLQLGRKLSNEKGVDDDDELKGKMSDFPRAPDGRRIFSAAPIEWGGRVETLEEPVHVSIRRDVRLFRAKISQVLFPNPEHSCLKNWDLVGPLFICVLLSFCLQASDEKRGFSFPTLFMLILVGASAVTTNIKLLGGKISIFQSICVLGYCLIPLLFASAFCHLLRLNAAASPHIALRFLTTTVGFGWAVYAATTFLSSVHPEGRRTLGVYPLVLFYAVVSWLVFSH
ncbi:Protein YIPF [Aphelenchoides fujianensis]|nr:Protein YIPF [Aphelenchoides fujianensis]